ncbi:DegV family protein [Pseudomarimonas arenosa]|nr:DegV family protein [Pseudomarimonas arenosa]
MRRVINQREALNRINVFPVPDGDTGSNLAFTLRSVLSGALSRRNRSVGELLSSVAADAVDGARGNSGAILAQFFAGLSESVGDAAQLSASCLARAAASASEQARGALAQPKEGTILSVIRAFADALQAPAGDFRQWFGAALASAQRALADTPKQLAVLRQAGVVDAGAQGFVDLLEGIHDFLLRRRVDPLAASDEPTQEFAGEHWHDDADASKPWCTECLIHAEQVDRSALHAALAAIEADSVVLAGVGDRLRVHAHVDQPGKLFDLASRFGTVTARKAEDMRAQHRAATRSTRVAIVTDSAADLPTGLNEQLPLDVVPVRVNFGAEDFLDRVSISPAEFYRRLRESSVLPQTSQPPPGDFRRQFELLLGHAEEVLYLGISRALSGTLQAGESAAARLDSQRIRVLDSGQASCGQALLVIQAAEMAAAGASAAEIAGRVSELSRRTHTIALAREVSFAVRGGRVPAWAGKLSDWLGLTPIARMQANGRLGVAGALLARRHAPQRFAEWVLRRMPKEARWWLMVGHCDAAEDAEVLRSALRQRLQVERDWLVEAGPAIGAHAGPGALVVGLLQLDA